MLRVLDLFSGIGGFSLGLERTGGFETVAFCEIEEFPRKVLKKHWPDVPCHQDVRKLRGSDVGSIDVICGGYPCQPFSTAGQRRGQKDDRHLWPEFNRLVAELRPSWVIGENVAGHISMGLDDVLSDLEGQGYACRTFVLPACAVGAHHRRDRTWTLAHAPRQRCREAGQDSKRPAERTASTGFVGNAGRTSKRREESRQFRVAGDVILPRGREQGSDRPDGPSADVADANNAGLQGWPQAGDAGSQRARGNQQPERCTDLPRAAWKPEPDVGRVAHGIPNRVDRLKALGNAVVPAVVEMIGLAILEAEHGAL